MEEGGVDIMIVDVNQEEDEDYDNWAMDDLTGEAISAELVAEARSEEMEFMKNIDLYEEVDTGECWRKTGRAPISTKFIDRNKGTREEPLVRCRLVARNFKTKGDKDRHDLFAATPPLEGKKMLFRMAVVKQRKHSLRKNTENCSPLKLLFVDVKKAHLNAKVKEGDEIYVELPEEARAGHGRCGKLKRWLYGMRPAASAWEEEYSSKLVEVGFRRGKAATTVFVNEQAGVRCVVHPG